MRDPIAGDEVYLYNHLNGDYDSATSHIEAVVNRGIYGWLVELPNLRVIEVLPVPDSELFRQIRPEERGGARR